MAYHFASRHARRRTEGPIFVVGCCNSGTTILWQALKSHPDLFGPLVEGQDLVDLPLEMRHFLGKQTFRMFAHPRFRDSYVLTEADYNSVLAARVDAVYAAHGVGGRRFIEKSPANSIRTRFLQTVFPDATFVMIVRSGMAVAEGIVRKRRFDPDRPHMAGLETCIQDAAIQWACANQRILADRTYLRRSILLRYEDLVREPAATLDQVFRFCGLDPAAVSAPAFAGDLNRHQIARLSSLQRQAVAQIIEPVSRVAANLIRTGGPE